MTSRGENEAGCGERGLHTSIFLPRSVERFQRRGIAPDGYIGERRQLHSRHDAGRHRRFSLSIGATG